MGVPAAMALYASPPSSVCSTAHQISSHVSYDLEVNARSASSTSPAQKPLIGGLSCLFSSSSPHQIKLDELGSSCSSSLLWHDKADELSSSFRCLSTSNRRDQSPVSVLQGPVSRSPPIRSYGSGGGMFGGFVRHASLGVDCYDSCERDVDLPYASAVSGDDHLTFSMEEGSVDVDMPVYARELLCEVRSRHSVFEDEVVVKAFCEAEKAHRGQERASGHPYLQHCVETAVLLADIGANPTVVAAGLLHDTLDDCSVTYDHVSGLFGAEVADLVKGVSKLSQLSKLARENNTASKTAEADRLHTMFLTMADARAVLIKLADRLHNMLTLDALPLIKQQRFAKETLEIFAPLANRLGIFTWKEQLENLCFRHLNPDHHRELSSKLVDSFDEAVMSSSLEKLEQALKSGGISYHSLSGRHKSLYSIYSKMMKKKLDMDEIHDIHGLRLIVETEEDCYKALNVIQQLWHELPGRFKDYIVYPKFNGYQSLHTVVTGEGTIPLEVQIRTKEMHLQAEYGFAAHWRYKEGDCKHSSFVLQMVEWARWAISWQCEAMSKDSSSVGIGDTIKPPCTFVTHSKDCAFSCKPHCGSDGPVFVIIIGNDKMSVQEFPANSSVMDVLEKAGRGRSRWTSYGLPVKEELRPRLNHEPVSDPNRKLKMGDLVELTPTIPDKSLTVYREEIQRMYDKGLTKSNAAPLTASSTASSRS